MRLLTLRREMSPISPKEPFSVYIEDPAYATTAINGVRVRPIGALRGGETLTVQINDQSAAFFVVQGELGKSFVAEALTLPAGDQDLFLIGSAVRDTLNGTHFYFHGITTASTLNHRKKGYEQKRTAMKVGLIVLIALLAVALFTVPLMMLADSPKNPINFIGWNSYTYEEISLKLPPEYTEELSGAYRNGDILITVSHVAKNPSDGDTLADHAFYVMRSTTRASSRDHIKTESGVTYFIYKGANAPYVRKAFFQSESRFYELDFSTGDISREELLKIASSVSVESDPALKNAPAEKKIFTFGEVSVTLNNTYESTAEGDVMVIRNSRFTLQIEKIRQTNINGDHGVIRDLAKYLVNNLPEGTITSRNVYENPDGTCFFEFRTTDDAKTHYVHVVKASTGDYYVIIFSAYKLHYDQNEEYRDEIISSVTVS